MSVFQNYISTILKDRVNIVIIPPTFIRTINCIIDET